MIYELLCLFVRMFHVISSHVTMWYKFFEPAFELLLKAINGLYAAYDQVLSFYLGIELKISDFIAGFESFSNSISDLITSIQDFIAGLV